MRRASIGVWSLLVAFALASGCVPEVPPATPAERARVRVVLYTTAWCPVCARARSWLHARGIPFEEHDVERDPSVAGTFRRLSPSSVVPVIDVEGEVIVGFVASDVRRAIDRRAHARTERAEAAE